MVTESLVAPWQVTEVANLMTISCGEAKRMVGHPLISHGTVAATQGTQMSGTGGWDNWTVKPVGAAWNTKQI